MQQGDPQAASRPGAEAIEVARANDRLEAQIWVRYLSDQGIGARMEERGGWLASVLFLGRRPFAVMVAPEDLDTARAFLTRNRFI